MQLLLEEMIGQREDPPKRLAELSVTAPNVHLPNKLKECSSMPVRKQNAAGSDGRNSHNGWLRIGKKCWEEKFPEASGGAGQH